MSKFRSLLVRPRAVIILMLLLMLAVGRNSAGAAFAPAAGSLTTSTTLKGTDHGPAEAVVHVAPAMALTTTPSATSTPGVDLSPTPAATATVEPAPMPREISQAEALALARAAIAAQERISVAELEDARAHRIVPETIGTPFLAVKFFHQQTEHIYDARVNLLTGEILSAREYRDLYYNAYRERFGKLGAALHQRLEGLGNDDVVEVAIWVVNDMDKDTIEDSVVEKYPAVQAEMESRPSGLDPELAEEQFFQFIQEYLEQLKAATGANLAPLMTYLQGLGYSAHSRSPMPSLSVSLPKRVILDIATRSDVAKIYLNEGEVTPAMDVGVHTIRVAPVWDPGGIDGSGRRIGILEAGTVQDNQCLDVVANRGVNLTLTEHAARVASVAACNHPNFPQYRGVAFDADIVSADSDGSVDDSITALEWVVTQTVHAINKSVVSYDDTALHQNDRAFDYWVREARRLIAVAAGNQGSVNGNVMSPGKGWNVVTVGGIDDYDTAFWGDDEIYQTAQGGSSRVNPQSPIQDKEKPEVMGVGEDVTMVGLNDQVEPDVSGTSYAAPQVAALAALLTKIEVTYILRPEAMKATLMASALHNLEGPSFIRHPSSDSHDDRDGAGVIVADLAAEIAGNRSYGDTCSAPCWWGQDFNAGSFDGDGYLNFYIDDVAVNDRVRVAIAWNANADGPPDYDFDNLDVAIDLTIFHPDGFALPEEQGGASSSWNNAYELVDFIAPGAGQYRIGIFRNYYWESGNNRLGVAWTKCSYADVDCDCDGDVVDIMLAAGKLGTNTSSEADILEFNGAYDLNRDFVIDVSDIQMVAGNWRYACP